VLADALRILIPRPGPFWYCKLGTASWVAAGQEYLSLDLALLFGRDDSGEEGWF
jgi:hypothetical protein